MHLREEIFGHLHEMHIEGIFDAAEPHVAEIRNIAGLDGRLDGLPIVLENQGDFGAHQHGGCEGIGIRLLEAELPKSPPRGEVRYSKAVAVAV